MLLSRRHGLVFAAGLAVGLMSGAGLLMGLQHMDPNTEKLFRAAVANEAPVAKVSPVTTCAFDPVLPAAADKDGKFRMQADASNATPADIPAYIAVASDAATQGRVRDAEMAYIISCRLAGQVAGANSPELADAKFHLAQHYLNSVPAASSPQDKATFVDIQKRAESLFSESVSGYGAKFGIGHDKTRQAAAGLAAIQAAVAVEHPTEGALMPRPLLMAKVSEYEKMASDTSVMGAAPAKKKVKAEPSSDPGVAEKPEIKIEAPKQEAKAEPKQEAKQEAKAEVAATVERNVTDTSPERAQPERRRSEPTWRREEPATPTQLYRELQQAPRQATGSATGGALGVGTPD